jgi:hypothetical protein
MQVTNYILKNAAENLLKYFQGQEPTAGEVDKLSEGIADLLVKNHNVSEGNI